MTGSLEIQVNGEPRALSPGTRLTDFIGHLGFDARTLLIEFNGEPLPRERWASTTLRGGDRLELFRVSAGG